MEGLCPGLGIHVVKREIDRTELCVAEEAFLCGSGYKAALILSIDRFSLGNGQEGPITNRLPASYLDVVRGVDKRFPQRRTPSPSPKRRSRPTSGSRLANWRSSE